MTIRAMRRWALLALLSFLGACFANEAAAPFEARRIAAHGNMTCAVDRAESVHCWGGAAGDRPLLIAGVRNPRALSVYDDSACAVAGEGTVICWGNNPHGQLGRPGEAETSAEQFSAGSAVPGMPAVREVILAERSACALAEDGAVWCWGDNHFGQLGDGTRTSRSKPLAVQGLAEVTQLAAADVAWCAVLRDGAVSCWGMQPTTPLAGPVVRPPKFRTKAVKLAGIRDAVGVAMGPRHVCALRAKGQVSCWGQNDLGQLGSERGDAELPVSVLEWREDKQYLPLEGARQMITNNETICTVARGAVRCWGNFGFDPGLVALQGSKGANVIGSMRGAAQIALTQDSHLCGASAEGRLMCTDKALNGKVDQIDQLAAAGDHICARRKNGQVACWPTSGPDKPVEWIDFSAGQ